MCTPSTKDTIYIYIHECRDCSDVRIGKSGPDTFRLLQKDPDQTEPTALFAQCLSLPFLSRKPEIPTRPTFRLLERGPDQAERTAQSAQRPSYPPHARKLEKFPLE